MIVEEGSWANVDGQNSSLGRVQLERVRMTGTNLANGEIRDVTFVECRVDLAAFRFAKLERVRFERCRMDEAEADFYNGVLKSVVFVDCSLVSATWGGAILECSEMRGCDLAGAGNPERLRGVRMPWPDVINAARELAAAAGIEIID